MNKLIAILAVTAMLSGCKGGAKLPEGAPPALKPRVLKEKLSTAENQFTSLRIKANGSFEQGGSKQGFRVEIRILKDSLVWIDVADPLLGIKVARAMASPGKVEFYNRLTREFLSGESAQLQAELGIGFGFDELQGILSGNLLFGLGPAFDLYYQPDLYLLADFDSRSEEAAARSFGQEKFRQVYVDPSLLKPTLQVQNEPSAGKRYSVGYIGLKKEAGEVIYPETIKVEYLTDQPATLTLEIRSVEKDDPELNYPFNIPSGYEEMR